MKIIIILIYAFFYLSLLTPFSIYGQNQLTQREKWEQKMQRYAKHDALAPPQKGVVLFVGSSTVENWKTLADDFPDEVLLNRGVSGTKTVDIYEFKGRLIDPYDPKKIFIYVGDNDIGLGWKTDAIMEQFTQLITYVRDTKPEAEIVFISIKPSPRRMKDREQVEEVNEKIRAYLATQTNMGYADVYHPMLTAEGELRPEYYREDGLHLTAAGYAIWKKVIEKFL